MSIDTPPPIGSNYHREFRDLDTKHLPSAPPRPGSTSHPEPAMTKGKTQQVIECLQKAAPDQPHAMKPAMIGDVLGGEAKGFDTSTVAALLRCAMNGNSYPELQREKRDTAFFWWWGEPSEQNVPENTAELSIADPMLARIQAIGQAHSVIPNAQLHADRLRAIGELPIIDAEIALWLETLAGLIEDTMPE